MLRVFILLLLFTAAAVNSLKKEEHSNLTADTEDKRVPPTQRPYKQRSQLWDWGVYDKSCVTSHGLFHSYFAFSICGHLRLKVTTPRPQLTMIFVDAYDKKLTSHGSGRIECGECKIKFAIERMDWDTSDQSMALPQYGSATNFMPLPRVLFFTNKNWTYMPLSEPQNVNGWTEKIQGDCECPSTIQTDERNSTDYQFEINIYSQKISTMFAVLFLDATELKGGVESEISNTTRQVSAIVSNGWTLAILVGTPAVISLATAGFCMALVINLTARTEGF